MKFRIFIYRSLLVAVGLLTKVVLFAQPSTGPPPISGGSSGTNPPCWDPECVPIDGGVGFLIVAGVALGAKKIHDQRNKSRA